MPDKEKVIHALETCISDGTPCTECEYFVEITDNTDNAKYDCIGLMMKDALALLREQEPVEPIEQDGWHYCGICGRSIDGDFADEELFQYCPNCGRKVKLNAAD